MPFKKVGKFSPFIPLIILVMVGYYLLPFGFFQQDEWLGLARFLQFKNEGFLPVFLNAFSSVGAHYTPFSVVTIYILFSLFHLNYPLYAIVSVILHIVACVLFFILVRDILGNLRWAFLAMLLFGVSAAGFQATAWPIADIGTHGSTIFGFLSIILFLKFIKGNNKRFFVVSLIALAASLLFKENTVGFFLLLPVLLFLFGKNSRQLKIKYAVIILLFGFLYFAFRANSILGIAQGLPQTDSGQQLQKLIYNVFSVPVKSTVQSLIPSFQIYDTAHSFTKILNSSITGIPGSPDYEAFVLKRVFEAMNFIIFIGIMIVGIIYFKHSDKKSGKIVIFGSLFIFLNSLVFAFAPERSGVIFTIDSRNLYLTGAGVILILTALLSIAKRQKLMLVPFVIYLFLNVWWLHKQIYEVVKVGKVRKEILSEIKTRYANLPEKVVFYTESDKSFYGLPANEKILPFQSGFGQTLLVWYDGTENWPRELFRDEFLWEITDQGYKENEERGFGYFRNFDLLTRIIEENNIPITDVVAFSFSSDTNQVKNITEEVAGRLEGFFAKKNKISQSAFRVNASSNEEVELMLDGNKETFWGSGQPYKERGIIDIDLGSKFSVAQLEIDSYNNKDQNEVGYEVFLSRDGENWESVFYAKRYIPNSEGLTDIYFKPQEARFVKVHQIGFHNYAPWVIHELNVYITQ